MKVMSRTKAEPRTQKGAITDTEVVLATLRYPGVSEGFVRRLLKAGLYAGLPLGKLVYLTDAELAVLLPADSGDVATFLQRVRDEKTPKAASNIQRRLRSAGVRMCLMAHEGYPRVLQTVLGESAPPVMYVSGKHTLLDAPSVAIVGARTPSKEGAALTAKTATLFARTGRPIVSGGAKGVDQIAHSRALDAGGQTVAVLPMGILAWQGTARLWRSAGEGRAALATPFPPEQGWENYAAVARNRLIAAMARLVVVIEPKRSGGSVETARRALQYGRPLVVYCPGDRNSPWGWLQHTSAMPLLTPSGSLDEERLLSMAAAPAPMTPCQEMLF
jgi:DNA protecting protein DprA